MPATRGIAGGFWLIQRADEESIDGEFDWYWAGVEKSFPDWTVIEDLEFDEPTTLIARWMMPQYTRVRVYGRSCEPEAEGDPEIWNGLRRCVHCRTPRTDSEWDDWVFDCTEHTP